MPEQSHEVSAKSVETAIKEGLRQLGVSREQVDIEILHEGSRGLLGIGSTNARVRLTPRTLPDPPEKSVPTVESTFTSTAVSIVEESVEETTGPDTDDEEEEQSPIIPVLEDGDDDGDEDVDLEDDEPSDTDLDEVIALSSGMLEELIGLMGMDAQVESSSRDDPDESDTTVYLNLVGDDLGSLIGRHGETLSSLQYLVRLMVNQKLRRWTNIVVDVEGYKERRAERLAQMALRMADQVVETGSPVALEPMPGNERRLIHIALRDHPHVYTESIGEDSRRKIQILLK